MRVTPRNTPLYIAIAAGLTVAAPMGLAQDGPMLEEIIVTAQNREQAIQDVPISMNVLTSEVIEKAGITDIRSLTRLAPDFATVDDGNITRVSLRGIATLDNGEAVDQALVINVDGEYVDNSRVLNTSMFDVERIEILRGPQGTLLGRNATAGAISIITKKPSLDGMSGSVSVDAGNFETRKVNAALNMPLTDTAAVRVALISDRHEGYNELTNFDTNSGQQDNIGGRLGLLLEPTEALSVYLAAEYVKQDVVYNTFASIDFNTPEFTADIAGNGTCSTPGWEQFAVVSGGGIACVPQNTNNVSGFDRDEFEGPITGTLGSFVSHSRAYRAEISYDLGQVMLNYRGGYRDTEIDMFDALPDFIFPRTNDSKTQSHEIRLSSDSESGIFWQTGIFYFDEDEEANGNLYSPFINIPVGPGMFSNGAFINGFYRSLNNESMAVFGQVEIPFAEQFTAILGARYTEDEKTATYYNLGFAPNLLDEVTIRPRGNATPIPLAFDNEELTWNVGLNWEPNENTLVYGKVSKGYKAGGFDSVGNFDSETVTAYEIGTKNTFARHTFNGSLFYYDYKDLQAGVLIDTTLGGQVFNAGEVTIWGIEASYDTWLTDADRLSLTANYLDAEYDEFIASIPIQCVGCSLNALPGDVNGNAPPNAPEWIFTLGYDHIWNLSGGSTLTGSIFSRYKDDYFNTIYNYNDDQQEAFIQTDASLEFEAPNGNWYVQLYVRNIEDKRPVTYATFISAGPADAFNLSFGPPRTYGLKVSYNF